MTNKILYPIGSKVRVTTETPEYTFMHNGVQLNGKTGTLVRYEKPRNYYINFPSIGVVVVPRTYLSAPSWFARLGTSEEMRKIMNNESRRKSTDLTSTKMNRNYFSSADLAKIKRNTNNNFHTENYVFIARKIGSDYTDKLENVLAVQERKGDVDAELNRVIRGWYLLLMKELKQKSPQEYKKVYDRL